MISSQPSLIGHQGLSHFFSYTNINNNSSSSPSPTPSAISVSSSSVSTSISPLSSPPSSPRTLSPERHFGPILFRLCPNTPYTTEKIVLGEWTSVNLKVIDEFLMAPNNSDPSTSLPLGPNESTLPLECSILQEPDINEDDDSYYGSVLPCIGISHLLVIESRGLQSASWFDGAFDSRSGPGIYKSGNGGLEFRVTLKDGEHAHRQIATTATATTITSSSSQDVFWIRIGSPRLGIVPLALGPYAFPSHRTWLQQRSRPRSQSPRSSNIDTIKVIRPFDIPSPYTSAPPRTLVLTEWHNHMPQGRVWDSAFIMLDIFRDKVSEGIRCLSAPLLAGKRILDLSTGSGLIGLYLAGLAEVEERNTRIPTTMTTITTMQQQTKVVMTDLSEAMELIHYNINNNSMIAPQVNISAQTLQWGESLDSPDFKNLDIVIASDVIYNIKAFESLLNTLIGLCVPGRTIIYLGYKRRHLSRGKETEIFAKIRSHFNVEETVHELGVRIYCLTRE